MGESLARSFTNRFVSPVRINSSADWMWFESVATYDNAKISQAMILSGYWRNWTSRGDVVDIGLGSLRWLVEQQKAERGHSRRSEAMASGSVARNAPISISNQWRPTP